MDRGDLEIPLPSVQFWELKTALKKLSLKKLLKGTEGSNEEGLTVQGLNIRLPQIRKYLINIKN